MSVYFTSDTHFSGQRALEFSKRPFKDIKEMNNYIINEWNRTVKDNDIVYHLGDFGNYNVLKKLKGKVILILGNYEIKDIENETITKEELIKKYGFYEIYDNLRIPELEGIYATHCPKDCNKKEFNLFGHIHEKQMVKRYGLNVGIDCHHFRLLSVDDIYFYKNAIENHYDENVFE